MSVERCRLAALSQATSERTPWDIPLHLLMTSRQGTTAPLGKLSRTFCVPALDGDRSPFGERHLLLPSSLPEQASEVTPRRARRPSAYLPAELAMCKLPLLAAKELDVRESARVAGYHAGDAEHVTPRERGCQSAPPTRQQPLFFVPTPPASASPTKRHRRARRVSACAATTAELSTGLPTAPKECPVKDRTGISAGSSPKVGNSQSADYAGDELKLTPIGPQEPASSKTPRRTHARRGSAFPGTGDAQSIAATSAPKELSMKHSDAISCAKSPNSDHCQSTSAPQDTPTGNSFAVDTPSETYAHQLHMGSTPPPAEPSSIVRWKIGEKIGAGAHGCVYKAQNLVNGHLFVAKESVVDDKEYRDKLWRELEICRDLNHPNIVKCLGHEYCDRHLYIHL